MFCRGGIFIGKPKKIGKPKPKDEEFIKEKEMEL